jgi:hypothetical protein
MFICALLLSAQTDEHAMTLLKQAIAAARTTTTFRAEGTTAGEMTGAGMNTKGQPIYFRAAAESPLRTHRENSGGDHTQTTCDGAETLYTGGSGFYRGKRQGGCVGSEVARLRAGHRPPLKLHVRFSRMQLSQRRALPRC